MAFAFPAGFDAAISRLGTRYNNGPYNPTTNPGGFDNEGHVVNFTALGSDAATAGQGLAAFAEYLNTSISPLIADAVASATTAAAGFAGTASTKAGEAAASAGLAAAQANRLSGTSATSNSIGTGARTFTTQADKFFGAGSTVTVSSDSNPSGQQMNGVVTGYSGTTLTVNVQRTTGSGTYADWTIRVAGALGANGVNGWTPITANVVDGMRIVQRVVDWIGGSGEKPATGAYIGPNGLTPTISEATNVRGASGTGSGNVNPSGTVAANHVALFTDATGNGIKSGGLLATVATSGAYSDLSGTPAIPATPGDIGAAEAGALAALASSLAPVATTGAYADLSGKPVLGTAAGTAASAYATAAQGTKADTAVQPSQIPAIPSKASTAEVIAGTDDTKFTTAKGITDAMAFVTFTAASVNLANLINGKITLAANSTFAAPSNAKEGQTGVLAITQDGTGGRTGSWNTFWDFGKAGVPTLSTGAGKTDIVTYVVMPGSTKAMCSFVGAA